MSILFRRTLMSGFFSLLLSGAAVAADVSLDRASFTASGSKITLEKIDVVGSSLSAAQLKQLFAETDATKASDILATLNAQSLKIGTLTSEASEGGNVFKLTVNAVELSNITAGKIAAGKARDGQVRTEAPDGKSGAGSFGKITLNESDLALMLRVQAPSQSVTGPLLPLYSEFSVEAVKFKPPEGGTVSVARITTRDGRVRPVEEPIQAFMAQAKTDFATMTPAEKARFVKVIAAAYASNALGSFEAQDIAFTDEATPDDNGKIARILYTSGQGNEGSRFAIEQFARGEKSSKIRIGNIAFAGWSLEPVMKTLVLAYGNPAAQKDPAPADLLPKFGTMELRDVSVESDGAFKGNASLQSFTLGIDNPQGGVPTRMRYAYERLAIPVIGTDKSSEDMRAMGYRDLDMSGAFDLAFRAETGDLELRDYTFRGANMGNMQLTAVLGNVTDVIKATSSEEAMLAATAVTLKRVALSVENRGLFERYIDFEARTKNKTPDQVRKEYVSATTVGLPMFIGMSAPAKAITASVTRFINKPERLTIAASAKDPNGFGVADYVGVASPDDVFKSLNVVANND